MAPAELIDFYPIELRYIRAICLQGEYRKCIQACRDICKLNNRPHANPLQKAFISFYEAISHDEIARGMHQDSVTKLPFLDSAEDLFVTALNALPSYEEARHLCSQSTRPRPDLSLNTSIASQTWRSPSISDTNISTLELDQSSRASSPGLPSPPVFGRDGTALRSPFHSPPAAADLEDLESHESFAELLTPTRVVKRDFSRPSLLNASNTTLPRESSRMSLIEPNPPQERSLSRGLMRPIPPGSPAKKYHISPALSYSGTTAQNRSKLPQLATRAKIEPRLEAQRVDSAMGHSSWATCHEPVSPMESDYDLSNASAVSALSPPVTPIHFAPEPRFSVVNESEQLDEGKFLRFSDHLRAMRAQLETHIVLVRQAKEQVQRAQLEKKLPNRTLIAKASRGGFNSKGTRNFLTSPIDPLSPEAQPSRVQQARSFWSFVPEDTAAAKKQARIQAGRDRKWKRDRFRPGRYEELCERALAEL